MNKEELLKFIENAINLEDKSIHIYSKHLNTAVFWSGLTEQRRKQVAESLDQLAKGSAKHIAILDSLKKRVERGESSVY